VLPTILAATVLALGVCAASRPAPARVEPNQRSLSTLHEREADDARSELVPFSAHASARAATSAETLRELAILPELVELSSIDGETAAEDLPAALEAYHRWVRRNGIAASAAGRALESAVSGPAIVVPRGTREGRREEVLTILHAIARSVAEAIALLERLDTARTRVNGLEARSRELVRRVGAIADDDARASRSPPGLYRATSANVYRAMELEADVLVMAATTRVRMNEIAARTLGRLDRVQTSIDCLSRSLRCGGDLSAR
jgi:hypothetical protein